LKRKSVSKKAFSTVAALKRIFIIYRQIQLGQFGGSYIKMYAYRQIEILENG